MDVTPEILQNHIIYGSSDYTAAHRHASGRSLNYVSGGSITKPENEKVTVAPYTLKYKDSVGLFGAENYFVKVTLKVTGDVVFACYEEEGWECAIITATDEVDPYWELAQINSAHNEPIEPDGYYQAALKYNSLPFLNGELGYFSVDLRNLKTGNKYVDSWLDVRLYTEAREEHPYDLMYVRPYDVFYIGFHARNTRRLPYDVECEIGKEFKPLSKIDSRYVMKR